MKKKGFTLVELLAVIAILAILVIIALPAVLRMFNSARKDSFTNEVNTIIRTARQQYLLSGGQSKTYSNAEGSTDTLNLTGNSRLKYLATIDGNGKITKLQVTNGDFQYNMTNAAGIDVAEISDVQVVSELSANEVLIITKESPFIFVNRQNEGSITAGDEVAIDTEHFYVISSDSTNTVLLSKYDLKQEGSSYIQDTSGTSTDILKVNMLDSSNTAYWDNYKYVFNGSNWIATNSTGGLISPYSDGGKSYCTSTSGENCAYVYDNNTSNIEPVVTAYANKIGTAAGISAIGKLMSLEQARGLRVAVKKDLNGYNYWWGSAYNYNNVWSVNGNGSMGAYSARYTYGVRPVIEIPTSAL